MVDVSAERLVYASFEIDEEMLEEKSGEGLLYAFCEEMQILKESGIELSECCIADSDDTVAMGRYVRYVFAWAMTHIADEEPSSPMTFGRWKNRNEK